MFSNEPLAFGTSRKDIANERLGGVGNSEVNRTRSSGLPTVRDATPNEATASEVAGLHPKYPPILRFTLHLVNPPPRASATCQAHPGSIGV